MSDHSISWKFTVVKANGEQYPDRYPISSTEGLKDVPVKSLNINPLTCAATPQRAFMESLFWDSGICLIILLVK